MGTLHWNSTYFHVDWKWCRWFSSQCLLSLGRRFCLYTFHIPFVWCSLSLFLCLSVFVLYILLKICVCIFFPVVIATALLCCFAIITFSVSAADQPILFWALRKLCQLNRLNDFNVAVFFLLSIWILFFKYFCNFGWIFIKCASVTYAPVVIILNLSLHVLNNNIFLCFVLNCCFKRSWKRKGKYAAHQM